MNLKNASRQVLDQLFMVVDQIKPKDYILHLSSLNASISQHVRHILEFYICLFEGLETGKINYDNRKRETRIENDKHYAMHLIHQLKEKADSIKDDRDLILQLKYGVTSDSDIELKTSLYRELAYNIEHTIHHLAIIKRSIIEQASYIALPKHFGVANSTVRYSHKKHQ